VFLNMISFPPKYVSPIFISLVFCCFVPPYKITVVVRTRPDYTASSFELLRRFPDPFLYQVRDHLPPVAPARFTPGRTRTRLSLLSFFFFLFCGRHPLLSGAGDPGELSRH